MTSEIIHLSGAGVSLVLDARGEDVPRVLHWGAALGALTADDLADLAAARSRQTPPATLDAPWELTLLPAEADGWSGRPGAQLVRDGLPVRSRWSLVSITSDGATCDMALSDDDADVSLTLRVEVAEGGVVWLRQTVRNRGDRPLGVDWLEATLPFSPSATHLTTLDGRWSREKRVSTTRLPAGSIVRQSRRGRPGHDAATFFAASEHAPLWDAGRVWAVHAAWSADTTYRVDRVTDSVPLLGAGELLRPGEIVLAHGEEYTAPAVAFVYSDAGLDGIARRVHTWMRARPQHPRTPRPFTLNTWEAVYFDHDPERLRLLADRAAEVGVERFVLDDGWFTGRRDDTTSLGDWEVDTDVWPDGLRPLADHVHARGMQFGLWFEPEMISLRSHLAARHPDWFLHDPRHLDHPAELSWRTQFVLDLANPDAYAHILAGMDALVKEIGIDYIKWDHNRDLIESVHDGRPGTHAQTVAVHRLIAELKQRNPGLEIESCSSGGARTDLGIMQVCDRVWASDSNDPVERQDIQRWTGLLLPPELVGAHVGPAESHSSGRVTPLSYRIATSLMGSAGLEWDILGCSDEELAQITRFTALYQELRPLLHTAEVVHPRLRDAAWRVTGYLSEDRADAVLIVATVAGLEDARAERLRIPGLDPQRRYRVWLRREIGEPKAGWVLPPWMGESGVELPGSVLTEVGLQLPTLWPVQAMVVQLQAV
ncbi:alpha-galactosidase [Microbacterium sp.]|uniref:alpha-galactosidase n=1 Tax=Microbacterium sp. TaxID=51671 RepID=UPI002811CD16|nr:alpha-galactosidase [Microbacterium sp.]